MRFIQGNIRMCQGCRNSLCLNDGSIPEPPFDLAIAHFERRSYRDKDGQLKTPLCEQAVHYHLKRMCVQAVAPHFDPGHLIIPTDVLSLLTPMHKDYLLRFMV